MTTIFSDAFWSRVESDLPTERDLWKPIVGELFREDGGPDAVKLFLETEQQRLQLRIEERLRKVSELVEG